MPLSDDNVERDETVHETYRPTQNRSLSEAVLDAIEAYKDIDVSRSEFVLFDAIDPDALDTLIQHRAEANPQLTFDVADVQVKLWGNSPTYIEIVDLPGG